jgi:hypothetical protein
MVDDDFVAAIGTERGLDRLSYGAACFYVADHGAVFGFVAVVRLVVWTARLEIGVLAFGSLA